MMTINGSARLIMDGSPRRNHDRTTKTTKNLYELCVLGGSILSQALLTGDGAITYLEANDEDIEHRANRCRDDFPDRTFERVAAVGPRSPAAAGAGTASGRGACSGARLRRAERAADAGSAAGRSQPVPAVGRSGAASRSVAAQSARLSQ